MRVSYFVYIVILQVALCHMLRAVPPRRICLQLVLFISLWPHSFYGICKALSTIYCFVTPSHSTHFPNKLLVLLIKLIDITIYYNVVNMNTTKECLWSISFSVELSRHYVSVKSHCSHDNNLLYNSNLDSYANYMHCLIHNIGIMKAFLTSNPKLEGNSMYSMCPQAGGGGGGGEGGAVLPHKPSI